MTSIGPLKLRNALLCDDIRQEAGTNKFILIGTYSGDIRLRNPFPGNLQLAVYLDFDVPPGEYDLEMRLSGPGKGSATLGAHLSQPEHETSGTMVTPRLTISFDKPGIFRVDLRSGDGRWVNVFKKTVTLDPNVQQEQAPPS